MDGRLSEWVDGGKGRGGGLSEWMARVVEWMGG